jgi:hypothetical protein
MLHLPLKKYHYQNVSLRDAQYRHAAECQYGIDRSYTSKSPYYHMG